MTEPRIPRSELAVVVPAYNEAAAIETVIHGVRRHTDHVMVVDDGSTDSTAALLAGLPVEVLRHRRNRGKGAALRTAFAALNERAPRWVLTIDADGQHDAASLPALVEAGRAAPDHLVIGMRVGKRRNAPRRRRVANRIADSFISWAAGCAVPDTQSGLRLYPGAALRTLLAQRRTWWQRFAWEAEVLIELCRRNVGIATVPVPSVYPANARASHYRPCRDSLLITAMVAGKLVARRAPLPAD